MKAVINIVGKDKVGIVHKSTGLLVKYGINIVDINQTIIDGYFNMIMIVDISEMSGSFDDLIRDYGELERELEVKIKVMHEDIFNAMHIIWGFYV